MAKRPRGQSKVGNYRVVQPRPYAVGGLAAIRYAGIRMRKIRGKITLLLTLLLLVSLLDGCVAKTDEEAVRLENHADRTIGPVWDFTSQLSAAQCKLNAQVYESLPDDDCDAENEFDPHAYDLATSGTPEALRELRKLEHGGGRQRQAAAGRAYLFLAQQALARGNREVAAEHALHVFLSGVPHRLRLEALRAYCSSASPEKSGRWIEKIASGAQDAAFAPLVDELRAAILSVLED